LKTLLLETKSSRLQLDLSKGGSIQKLILTSPKTKTSKEIIIRDDSLDFFLSGSYLLYPWVNRIANRLIQYRQKSILLDPPICDENQYPIHGLFFSTKRIPLKVEETDMESSVLLSSEWNHPKFPVFTETFTLYPDRLQILTKFENTTTSTQYFSYGYHPYFQLDTKINTCTLTTNLDTLLPLRKDLLPEAYFLEGHRNYLFLDGDRINTLELDHCLTNLHLTEDPFVKFQFPLSGESIKVSSKFSPEFIPLPYFQLYTPPDRKTIAIEPLSSSGNVFENSITSPVEINALSTLKGKIEIKYE
jgi:galactose mutarotase-like enzyme